MNNNMSEANNNVKLPMFLAIVVIFIGIVSGALLWIRNDLSRIDNRVWNMQENLAKIPGIEKQLENLTNKVEEGRRKTGDSSFNLLDLIR